MDKKISFLLLILLFSLTICLRWNSYNILTGYDSYYHYRKADELLHNEISDVDYLRRPAEGTQYAWNFYHYLTAYSYKLVPFISLEKYMVYIPLIFSLISVFLMYQIGKQFRDYTGIFAGFLVASTPILVERTNKTFADTDALVLLFVSLLIYFFVKFYLTKNLLYLCGLGFTLFVFQTFWTGYWFYVYIFLGTIFIYALVEIRKSIRNFLYFIVPSVIYIVPATLYEKKTFSFLLHVPKYSSYYAKRYTQVTAFDVSETVGELQNVTLGRAFSLLGIILPLGILGCIILLYLVYRERKYYPLALLVLFLLIPSASTLRAGHRFLFYFAIPLLLVTSLFLGFLFQNIWRVKYRVAGIILVFLSLSLCIYQITINKEIERSYPDENWREALSWMNSNIEEDAVVLAWWDYGYWIEALGRRASYTDNGHNPSYKVQMFAEILISEDTTKLKELQFENMYILLTERELYHFEMISRYTEEQLEYMVRFPRKYGTYYDFSTFYDEHLITERNGTIKIGNERNYRPFNGSVYSAQEYSVVFPKEWMPSRIFIVDPKLENALFTELYLHEAEEIPNIEMIKVFKKIKIFKVYREWIA